MKKKPKNCADALLDCLLDCAGALVRTLHEAVTSENGDAAQVRSIKELTGAAKELTALVKSIGERTVEAAGADSIEVRFVDSDDYTH